MIQTIQNVIESRASVNNSQTGRPLGNEVIASLVSQATQAPSAYNMQNWRFIAVQSEDAKARLKSAAFGQQKIMDASVAFIICGTLAAHTQLANVLKPSVEADIMKQATANAWVAQASASHEGNSVLQRDEAMRSASLAAMTLMLAAQGMGLGSCPMSGFDATQVAREFGLAATELPVVIVAVGYPAIENSPQKVRKAPPEVLSIV